MILDVPGPPTPDPCPAPRPPAFLCSRAWRRAMGVASVTLGTVVVGVALLGALVTPPLVMVAVGPALGLMSGGVVLAVDPVHGRSDAGRRLAVGVGVAGALLLPFVAGLGVFGSSGPVVALAVVGLGCLVATDRLVRADPRDDDPAAQAAFLREVLPVLPTAEVLRLWRATDGILHGARAGPEQARAVDLRAALLDELTRRDPVGVERWLRAGGGMPDDHIRADLSG